MIAEIGDPPTRTRPATSAAVRPVRIATASRSGPLGGEVGQAPQRSPGERDDRGRAGVARPFGQGPVEVGDDEQPTGTAGQGGDRGDGCATVRGRERAAVRGRSRRPTTAQGSTSTPGMILPSAAAVTAGPMPPRAPSRTIPWASRSEVDAARQSRPNHAVPLHPGRAHRKVAPSPGEGRHGVLLPVTSTRPARPRRSARQPGHLRELVLAGYGHSRRSVDPDGLAAQGGKVDCLLPRPRDRQRRRRLADVEPAAQRRWPTGRPRWTAQRWPLATGCSRRARGRGWGRRRRRVGGEREDPPEHQPRGDDAAHQAGHDRQA